MNIRELGVGVDPSDPSEPKAPHWWVILCFGVLLAVMMYGIVWGVKTDHARSRNKENVA